MEFRIGRFGIVLKWGRHLKTDRRIGLMIALDWGNNVLRHWEG